MGQMVERVLVLAACIDDGAEAAGCAEGDGHAGQGVLRRDKSNAHGL
jgi:hypothetical protein